LLLKALLLKMHLIRGEETPLRGQSIAGTSTVKPPPSFHSHAFTRAAACLQAAQRCLQHENRLHGRVWRVIYSEFALKESMPIMRRLAVLLFAGIPLAFVSGCGSGGSAPSATSAVVTLSINHLAFISITNGTVTAVQNVTVTNTGNAFLTGIGITLTGTNASNFALPTSVSPCGATLASGASCIMSADFTAPAGGNYTATVSIADSAAGSPQTISLTGMGAAASGDFSPSPGSLIFATTVDGTTTAAQTLTFTNSGTATDTVSSVAISGTNAADFAQTNNCTSIAAGSSCAINVTFDPSTTSGEAATLTVTDNSNGTVGTTHTAALTGSGVASATPTVTVSPGSLSFTSGSSQPVTVTNTGASAVSITSAINITGTNASLYSQTNDCGTSIAIGASCTISVTFAPGSTSSSTAATLNIPDNATGNPHTVGLSGTASAVITFLPTSLTLTEGTLSVTSTAQTVKLTNTGTAAMSAPTVAITGTNAARFAVSSNGCIGTLAINANCSVSVTFTPTANGTVTANLTFTDTATGSPQTVALTGNGPGAATTTMNLVTVPDDTYNASSPNTMAQVDNFVLSATSTIDMTIYELTDTALINDLVTQCHANGLTVRVILDINEQSTDQSAHDTIVAGGSNCLAVFSNAHFPHTHEKSIVIDSAIPSKARLLISTGNFEVGPSKSCGTGCTYNFYATGRDFQLYENDANDVAAVESTFNEDFSFSAGTTYPTSPHFVPPAGDDLVWSPTGDGANSRPMILTVINGATQSLILDQEEMSDSQIVNALAAKAASIPVKLSIPAGELSSGNLSTLKTAGVQINEYPASSPQVNALYVHAKVVIADAGTTAEKVYLGSENMSTASLSSNRELGIILTDATASNASTIIGTLNTKLTNDFNCVSKPPTESGTPTCTTP
jgi:phosphatidylserine/phosphatidylglycerophosphate/cardiolipin synthase-like enzyme